MPKISPHKNYHSVTALDIEELLPFVKKETKGLMEGVLEEKRVKTELEKFIKILKGHINEEIYYIGEEKKFGKHLERFLFENGGFFEIMIESPVSINAHFLHRTRAHKFCKGLKKTIDVILPESQVKGIFINSINVGKREDEPLTYDKWNLMHKLGMHKTFVYTIIALILVLMFEAIQTTVEYINSEFFHFDVHMLHIAVVNAVFIAIFFEPIKLKVSKLVDKFLTERK